ncbi:hypothetical protein Bbelb_301550, partial [Branchiostoma belcheri]
NKKEALQKAVGMELVGTGIGSNEVFGTRTVEDMSGATDLAGTRNVFNSSRLGQRRSSDLTLINKIIESWTRIEIVENAEEGPHYLVLTVIVVGCLAGVLVAVIAIYFMKRSAHRDAKLQGLTGGHPDMDATADYQELCRQRMASKATEKPEPMTSQSRFSSLSEERVRSPSSRSSTSSW